LTAALKKQQQGLPDAFKQYDVDDCLQLSSAVLHTWKLIPMMLQQRGAELVLPTLLPMTALAMATFRACAAAAAAAAAAAVPPRTAAIRCSSSSSSSSSSKPNSTSRMGVHEIAMKQAAGTASMLAAALIMAVMNDSAAVRRQLQDHREVLELLLANVAACASQLYYQSGGKTVVQIGSQASSSSSSSSSSSKVANKKGKQPSSSTQGTSPQKHEFPCVHDHLFAALGCAGAAEILGVPEDRMDGEQAVQIVTAACSTVATALQLLGDPSIAAELDSSSSSSSAAQCVHHQQWRQLLTPEVCLGLLDATQQLLLLQPEISVADTALAMVYQACSYTPLAPSAHTCNERWQDLLWHDLSAVDCMRQLLRQLVPAVQHSLQAESSIPEGRRSRTQQESDTQYGLGRLLTVVALKGGLRLVCFDAVPVR
jgi:hypothetical protein